MEYNLIANIEYCGAFVSDLKNLLLYSHIPPALVATILAIFVYIKNSKLQLSRILLAISFVFATWVGLNLAIWFGYAHASILMGAWSVIEIFSVLLFALSFQFCYTYIEKKDLTIVWKILLYAPVIPVIFFATTNLFLVGYDPQECVAIQNPLYEQYVLALKFFYSIVLLGYLGWRAFGAAHKDQRRQISILGIGVISFLYSFLIAGRIGELTGNYTYELYGLFAIAIFIGALAYLIVKYAAFNIKLIGAQALVVSLGLLVASQIFYYTTVSGLVINLFTILLVAIFGYFLVDNVKKEIKQREEIEQLADKLKQVNKRLRELDRQKSEFVSIASHQLRSPLTAIRGYASMLLEGSFGTVPKKAEEALSRIHESSKYMALSIEDFLNVSRIEQGRMKYELSDFDLKDIAEKVVDELRPAAIKKGLVLMFRSECSGKGMVNADIGKTRQVLYNLIDNAMKYTPKGSITVIAHDDPKKKKMYVTIHDTGVGMSTETLNNIFEKFVRAKNANSVNVSGTGLGLFVARQMIMAMKGSVTAYSDGEGKGSKFVIELPLV